MRKLLFRKLFSFLVFVLLLPSPLKAQVQLGLGVQELIFLANASAAPQTGTTYSIPGAAVLLTWITSYASAPSSVTVNLEVSNDNVVWAVADTSTSTAGESRSIFTAARFVRAIETARSGGGAITLSVIVKSGPLATVVSNTQISTPLSLTSTSIATTSTDGILLNNPTLSTAAIPVQQSPRLRFCGNVWNTTAVAANNTDCWWIESVPGSSTAPGNTGSLKFGYSANGGATSFPVVFTSIGSINLVAGAQFASTNFTAYQANGKFGWVNQAQITSPADAQINFTNNALSAGIGFSFATDSVLAFRTRAQNAYATVDALGYRASGVAGASCVLTSITNLTVVNGIITVCN